MQDSIVYTSIFVASFLVAQVPDVPEFKELSATVILGVLFWYTLTRVNAAIGNLTAVISELKESIHEVTNRESSKEKE